MQTIHLPDGRIVTCGDSLDEKVEAMEKFAIPFTPTQQEIDDDKETLSLRDLLKLVKRLEKRIETLRL